MIRLPFLEHQELTLPRIKKAERDTILSSCCTAMGDVPFTDAAIIILYANMLGAGDAFSLLTTCMLPLAVGIFSIPIAGFILKYKGHSYQAMIHFSTVMQLIMFGLIAAAPLFGSLAVPVLIGALAVFAVFYTLYSATWYPMLDTFLTPERRSLYLGRMRFSWQLSSAVLLFIIGLLIGEKPPVSSLQYVMLFSMVVFSIKFYFISQVPQFPHTPEKSLDVKSGLATALGNKSLTGYSVYLFILNLAAYGTIPMTTLYLKRALHAPDNIIVLISSITFGGMLIGSFCAGRIIVRYGIRRTFLCVHAAYAVTNLVLFFLSRGIMPDNALYITISVILFIYSFTLACSNISSSSEMMAIATPGNKVMAMAFCNSFMELGMGLSRLLSSVIIGSGALALSWTCFGLTICHYQTMFLIYAGGVAFAAALLVIVPAIFPKGEYHYTPHH